MRYFFLTLLLMSAVALPAEGDLSVEIMPNPAIVNQPVTISVLGRPASTDYKWFIEGFRFTGNPIKFTVTSPGGYTIVLEDEESATGKGLLRLFNVTVTGTKGDADLDGVPNELETALGTNPSDAGSTPVRQKSIPSSAIAYNLKVGIDLNRDGRDSLGLTVLYGANRPIDLDGKLIFIQIGGLLTSFKASKVGNRVFTVPTSGNLTEKLVVRQTAPSHLTLKLNISKSTLASLILEHPNGISSESLSVPAFLIIGNDLAVSNALLTSFIDRGNGKLSITAKDDTRSSEK
jgi:hypothetical protein